MTALHWLWVPPSSHNEGPPATVLRNVQQSSLRLSAPPQEGFAGRFGPNEAGNVGCCAPNSEVGRQNEKCRGTCKQVPEVQRSLGGVMARRGEALRQRHTMSRKTTSAPFSPSRVDNTFRPSRKARRGLPSHGRNAVSTRKQRGAGRTRPAGASLGPAGASQSVRS